MLQRFNNLRSLLRFFQKLPFDGLQRHNDFLQLPGNLFAFTAYTLQRHLLFLHSSDHLRLSVSQFLLFLERLIVAGDLLF